MANTDEVANRLFCGPSETMTIPVQPPARALSSPPQNLPPPSTASLTADGAMMMQTMQMMSTQLQMMSTQLQMTELMLKYSQHQAESRSHQHQGSAALEPPSLQRHREPKASDILQPPYAALEPPSGKRHIEPETPTPPSRLSQEPLQSKREKAKCFPPPLKKVQCASWPAVQRPPSQKREEGSRKIPLSRQPGGQAPLQPQQEAEPSSPLRDHRRLCGIVAVPATGVNEASGTVPAPAGSTIVVCPAEQSIAFEAPKPALQQPACEAHKPALSHPKWEASRPPQRRFRGSMVLEPCMCRPLATLSSPQLHRQFNPRRWTSSLRPWQLREQRQRRKPAEVAAGRKQPRAGSTVSISYERSSSRYFSPRRFSHNRRNPWRRFEPNQGKRNKRGRCCGCEFVSWGLAV